MLRSIRDFFNARVEIDPEASEEDREGRVKVAACALLLELAHADDEFSEVERRHLSAAVEREFDLDREAARSLIQLADEERRRSVDLFQFTRLISDSYDQAQKAVLAEMMWGLIYADGSVARHEAYLMTKISRLLDVEPGFLAAARKKVERRGG